LGKYTLFDENIENHACSLALKLNKTSKILEKWRKKSK
jgi:hypothetical protein